MVNLGFIWSHKYNMLIQNYLLNYLCCSCARCSVRLGTLKHRVHPSWRTHDPLFVRCGLGKIRWNSDISSVLVKFLEFSASSYPVEIKLFASLYVLSLFQAIQPYALVGFDYLWFCSYRQRPMQSLHRLRKLQPIRRCALKMKTTTN